MTLVKSAKSKLMSEMQAISELHPSAAIRHLDATNYNIAGIWARELHIPADVLIVGAMYTKPHFLSISKGSLVIDIDGRPMVVTAPAVLPIQAWTQKAFVAIEDSTITTFIQSEAACIDDMLREVTTSNPEDFPNKDGLTLLSA